ncbi:5-carboxymethyl-2-hydroxymuconate isomerase [Hydrogenophaga crassostreae]|uniref:5-carboxymethyl-2-hydroxymuconate isomerase n=1 Tax=Hydrogenophaga crassostreae TaxID=1763535 RepID=A0A167HDA1_9BURK|nr:fumarylacetoacetate hydrolase family protein [Hydrogenophaga crassostreae]AOW12054.1 5-carboxymethyl-2-hydroxymuconate isomerase [Hydrogenophaga crassostreae]OAD40998.1 5-carboxymethyl-2-hydroxymuconate isomerase [Hydrogenophaga crassostreae]
MPEQQALARYAVGTFSHADGPPFAGFVLDGDRVIALDALHGLCRDLKQPLPQARSTLALFEQWSASSPALQAAANALANPSIPAARAAIECLVPMADLTVHPPVAARQIFMCGANYFKHVVDLIVDLGPGKTPGTDGMNPAQLRAYAQELMTRRRSEGSPYVFSKPVSVLSGAFDPIAIPAFAKQPDWELELAVVIGAPARYVKQAEALSCVAGYTIANDITNRDHIWTSGDMKAMGTDWLTAKSCPTYLPVGPYIVPASQIADPQQLQVQLRLNGQTMQDESTSDMIFGVARLIEHLSSVVQLLPGDLICTGSPSGNGTHYQRFLQPGDTVEGSITGLGTQRTPVIAEQR